MARTGAAATRRAELINATLTCISNHGMDGMTLDKVAEYAGCSKGVVAYHFENKDHLTCEAFKAFLAYYGLKIESEIQKTMTAEEMLDISLKYMLPPYDENTEKTLNVSQLDGVENMFIPIEDQARLFVQFFSRAVLDPKLQEVASKSYETDMNGIAQIFNYGNLTGEMHVDDPFNAAYGLFAMVVGLSFFRVANVQPPHGEDNAYISKEYLKQFTKNRGKQKP